jgi:hypothetical protein
LAAQLELDRCAVVGQPDGSGLTDVYLRPPKAFLEPKSLAAVLRKRLAV